MSKRQNSRGSSENKVGISRNNLISGPATLKLSAKKKLFRKSHSLKKSSSLRKKLVVKVPSQSKNVYVEHFNILLNRAHLIILPE